MGICLSAHRCFSPVGQRMVIWGLWGWVLLLGEWEGDNKRKTTVKLGYYITKGLGYRSGKTSEVFKQIRTVQTMNTHKGSLLIQLLMSEATISKSSTPKKHEASTETHYLHERLPNSPRVVQSAGAALCLLAIKSWMPMTGEQAWAWRAGLLVCWLYIMKPLLVVKIWCPNVALCVRWAENSYSMSCVLHVC